MFKGATMLERLDRRGFKSLNDVSIELGSVNVFIGSNGSGKSDFLEAVGVLGAIVSGGPEPESFRYRGVRQVNPASYISSFKTNNSRAISITASDPRITYSVDLEP